MRKWHERLRRSGDDATLHVVATHLDDPPPPVVSVDREGAAYDLVDEAHRLALVRWSFDAAEIGAHDGRAEVPLGREGEVPQAVAMIRRHGWAELGRVSEVYEERRNAAMVRQAKLVAGREAQEKRCREAIIAYEGYDGSSFDPRYRTLELALAVPPTAEERQDDDVEVEVALSHTWHIDPVWYWLASVVLVGAEFPLSLNLASNLVGSVDLGSWQDAAKYMLAGSITAALLVAVKLAGTLFRRAQTQHHLATRVRRLGSLEATQDAKELEQSGWIRAWAAAVLVISLVLTTFLLAEYRAKEFAEAEAAAAERVIEEEEAGGGSGSSLSAAADGSRGEIEVDVAKQNLLRWMFLAILGLTLLTGILLAWASTDPKKERRPALGRGLDHRAMRRAVDKAQARVRETDVELAAVEVVLEGLADRLRAVRRRIGQETAATESAYWQANIAHRKFVLDDAYLRWVAQANPLPPPIEIEDDAA